MLNILFEIIKPKESRINYCESFECCILDILKKILAQTEYWSIISCILESNPEFTAQVINSQNFKFLKICNSDFYKIIVGIIIKLVPIILNDELITYIASILMALIVYIEKIQSEEKIDSNNFLKNLYDFSLIWDVILQDNQFIKIPLPFISISETETIIEEEVPMFHKKSLNKFTRQISIHNKIQKFLLSLSNLLISYKIIKNENQMNNHLRIGVKSKKIKHNIKYSHDEISSQEDSD